ncbi:MAG TPA: GNAT family N-acetyltransferase [Steroidobacteraceae bacterium]|nr:GNAT family N-acetyltransferase [Steroidobacteraceae bacterium]
MLARQHTSIDQLDPKAWNALAGSEVPFLRHEFLAALEHSGCVGPASGWTPSYITLHDDTGLAAAAPAFLKSHSFGEFVFDFSWAEAYAQFGRNYYPKLTVCVPFTPATGARLLLRPDLPAAAVRRRLAQAIEDFTSANRLSSAHALFFDEPDREAFEAAGWLLRRDCQFHWTNQGFSDFEHYLSTFTADKRKKARRERRRVQEAGIAFETRFGTDIGEALLDTVYAFHRGTFLRHGHEPYLSRAFFSEIARSLGEGLMFKIAMQRGKPVAAAVFFWCQEALYGRYWGAAAEHHSLHFETCYHQGIEFCIERGIRRFEPGTQGEHKVARGFAPALTWSAHHIGDRRFRAAVRDFLVREAAAVDAYAHEVGEHVPYRRAP